MKRTLTKILSLVFALALVIGCVSVTACKREEVTTLTAIEITTQPTKTQYTVGESFDKSGMVVTAVYSDGSKVEVTDYSFRPNRALTKADTQIEVGYQKKSQFVNITVTNKIITGTEYKFEAENAALEGEVSSKITINSAFKVAKDEPLGCYNAVAKANASGGYCLFNFNKAGNAIIFTINSDTATEANLTVGVAARCTKKTINGVKDTIVGWDVEFDDMYDTYVNDEVIKFGEMVAPKNGNGNPTDDGYFEFYEVTTTVQLEEGENEIVFEVGTSKKAGNFDYIKLVADATLTDASQASAHSEAEGWTVAVVPTEASEGQLVMSCTQCGKHAAGAQTFTLPALNKTDYVYSEVVGEGTYTYVKDGYTFNFDVNIPVEEEEEV